MNTRILRSPYNNRASPAKAMTVAIKRVYEPASRKDGARVLVDRLWPRGLSKPAAAVDEWLRDLAPSDSLRRAFHAQTHTWPAFRGKYLKELSHPESEIALRRLYDLARQRKRLTLLYASKNVTHNNAVVLKELLDGRPKPPTGTGPGAVTALRRRGAGLRRR
jgi:uncharacterized protein YeaO (DUF488 family)